MRDVIRNFYEDLYEGAEDATIREVEEYCNVLPEGLKEEEGAWLAEEVEELEVEKTLKSMAKNKTPGGDVSRKILVNGFLGESFEVRSGVRQGCPLSPFLFICVMEPLLQHVQQDKVFEGFFVPGVKGEKLKSLCYMDDAVFLCKSQRDLARVELQLQLFLSMAGMRVSWDKSAFCMLSGLHDFATKRIKKVDTMDILGIHFEKNLQNQVNAEKCFGKISKKLELWKLRRLTLVGKILVIKAVCLPLLLNFGVVFPFNKRWVQKFTRLLFLFFWGSKMDRVARTTVMKEERFGGQNFPNVENFLGMHSWLLHYKIFTGGGRAMCFMRYLMGWFVVGWG